MSSGLELSASSCNPALAWSMGSGGKGRILIRFPMALDNGWYREQPCTTFRTFEHRKERKGFKHEFIVLRLLDGSVCRIERMGDPDARFDAISPRGSVAHDMAQCFRPDELEQACLDTSDIISTITLPFDCDLMDVLKICRAIHEGEKTRNYTLQVYNCYFFSLAIQACLTRLVAHWEDEPLLKGWLSQVGASVQLADSVTGLPHALRLRMESPSSRPIILELLSTLLNLDYRNLVSLVEEMISGVQIRLTKDPESMYRGMSTHISGILWHSTISSGLNQFMEDQIKEVFGEILKNRVDRLSVIPSTGTSDLKTNILKKELYLVLTELLVLSATTPGTDNSSKRYLSESKSVRAKPLRSSVRSIMGISLLDFKGSPIRLQDESGSSLAEWCQWVIKHLPYLALWLLYTTLRLWGVTISIPETNFTPLVSIEDELRQALTRLKSLETTTCSDLEQFVSDLRALAQNEGTVWYTNPWTDICDCITQHITFDIITESERLGATVRSCSKVSLDPMLAIEMASDYMHSRAHTQKQCEPEDMGISAFQTHIISRIKLQAQEVQSVWLGSAETIETELEGMLSEVWKMIREDDGLVIPKLPIQAHIFRVSLMPEDYFKLFPLSGKIGRAYHAQALLLASLCHKITAHYRKEKMYDAHDALEKALAKTLEAFTAAGELNTNNLKLSPNSTGTDHSKNGATKNAATSDGTIPNITGDFDASCKQLFDEAFSEIALCYNAMNIPVRVRWPITVPENDHSASSFVLYVDDLQKQLEAARAKDQERLQGYKTRMSTIIDARELVNLTLLVHQDDINGEAFLKIHVDVIQTARLSYIKWLAMKDSGLKGVEFLYFADPKNNLDLDDHIEPLVKENKCTLHLVVRKEEPKTDESQ